MRLVHMVKVETRPFSGGTARKIRATGEMASY